MSDFAPETEFRTMFRTRNGLTEMNRSLRMSWKPPVVVLFDGVGKAKGHESRIKRTDYNTRARVTSRGGLWVDRMVGDVV